MTKNQKFQQGSKWSSLWFKGLDASQKKDMHDVLGNNNLVLDKLNEIIDAEIKRYEIAETTDADFNNSNWPYLQAKRVGSKSSLLFIKKLIGGV